MSHGFEIETLLSHLLEGCLSVDQPAKPFKEGRLDAGWDHLKGGEECGVKLPCWRKEHLIWVPKSLFSWIFRK